MAIKIPCICPNPSSDPNVSFISSQPIIMFKELEVDRVRYDIFKAGLNKSKQGKFKPSKALGKNRGKSKKNS